MLIKCQNRNEKCQVEWEKNVKMYIPVSKFYFQSLPQKIFEVDQTIQLDVMYVLYLF